MRERDEAQAGTKKLLSMLTAKAGISQSLGGIPTITPDMVAAAMSGTDKFPYLLVLRVWCLDESNDEQLKRLAYLRAVDLAVSGRWNIPKGREYIRKMALLALREVIHPATCPDCKGTCGKWDQSQLKAADCPACGGSGRVRMDDKKRAAAVGMDPSRWSRLWGRRYERIYYEFCDAEQGVLEKIAKGVRHG